MDKTICPVANTRFFAYPYADYYNGNAKTVLNWNNSTELNGMEYVDVCCHDGVIKGQITLYFYRIFLIALTRDYDILFHNFT